MVIEGMAGSPQLLTLYGEDAEYMGRRSFFTRRARAGVRFVKRHPVATAAVVAPAILGRSFFRRQAARASKVVRPLTHTALNVVDKIPVYNAISKGFRAVTKTSDAAPATATEAAATPGGFSLAKLSKGQKIGLGVGTGVLTLGLVAAAMHHGSST